MTDGWRRRIDHGRRRVTKGSLVVGPDDGDPTRFNGEVQLDDRYQGALSLTFTGRRVG